MFLAKRYRKQIFSLAFMFSVIFSGQSIGHAEDQNSVDLVPTMTSNTSPTGIASANNIWSTETDAYKAFDDDEKTYWHPANISHFPYYLGYEFPTETAVGKYTIKLASDMTYRHLEAPTTWMLEGWNGTNWISLDVKTNITGWKLGEKREFTFNNSKPYKAYRLNITANNGHGNTHTVISEIEFMEGNAEIPNPDPDPDPDPDPKPQPSGDNALLVIKMISGLEKEFELTASEVQNFIDWYNDRADGRGKETYMFDKDFNKGPFTARKDYIAFSKIQSFEVMEYTK
ncbi:discoidin domain-containing protein [Brevibacillus fortis]|uniref:discoidin domain-containing protein n=1 Tax=Brevibacillus fortis TaxID=2126352 RepID=UPI002E212B7F|nr:discoidin domain-containing protein [Brevibacillus fortis]